MHHELAVLEGDPAGDPTESNETMDESDEPLEVDMGVQIGCLEEGPEPGAPARKAGHMDSPSVAISVLPCLLANIISEMQVLSLMGTIVHWSKGLADNEY